MKYFFTMICVLIMAGCANVEYVYVQEKVPITIPEELFIYPTIPAPPNKDNYAVLSESKKELALANHILDLQEFIKSLIIILKNIQTYSQEQQTIIETNVLEFNRASLR